MLDAVVELEKRRVATSLAQSQQGFENDDVALRQAAFPDRPAHLLRHRQADGVVEVALTAFQHDALDNLALGRQFGSHLLLRPPQQERLDALREHRRSRGIAAFFGWRPPFPGKIGLFCWVAWVW